MMSDENDMRLNDKKFILKMFHSDSHFYASVKLVTLLRKIPDEKILQQLSDNRGFLDMLNRRHTLRRKLSHFFMKGLDFSSICEPMWNELIETDRVISDSVIAAAEAS